ncbi:hypothetical protein [Coxiella burnetii]|uniref:hypothetical protein n=1 Tax=Coxiella burnetii TaxID=777 RepID=UPI000183CF41|nr:hypothetical protein [Coxiella burnetii]ACJ18590.1 hypothetical exported protein [Coxiella burnetii CbuG_Q212]ATN66970.1 hypothetical protein AYM17_06195 [Coxiella burnetii]OYK86294.1 hypothetical protein CbuQ229_06445 [Coxiella burnetii]
MRRKSLLNIFSIIFLSTLTSLAWADMTVTKRVDRYGFLQGVLLQSKDVSFRVNTYGYLESVTPHDPKHEALIRLDKIIGKEQVLSSAQKLSIKYYPASALNGNGGKIAEANGIRVSYYPCAPATCFSNAHYYGQKFSANNNSLPFVINPRYRGACSSTSGNGGKVRRIGDINFSYYPSSTFSSSGGKLQRVGDTVITYFPQNSFQGKGGQLKNFNAK